jgi:hypothetical protein
MHYAILVITNTVNEAEIHKLLAPYSEHLEVAPYVRYTRESAAQDRKDQIEEFTKLLDKPDCNKKYCQGWIEHLNTFTDDSYFKDICEEYEDFDSEGNPLSTYNKLSKWDWYSIGGRWDGFLKDMENKKYNTLQCFEVDWDKTFKDYIVTSIVDQNGNWFPWKDPSYLDQEASDNWNKMAWEIVKAISPDLFVTVVDIHI